MPDETLEDTMRRILDDARAKSREQRKAAKRERPAPQVSFDNSVLVNVISGSAGDVLSQLSEFLAQRQP